MNPRTRGLVTVALASGDGHVWSCASCETSAGPWPSKAEAQHLARVHDGLHHGGRQTAAVSAQSRCESCGRAPATVTWTRPEAGAPFALCARCAPPASASEPAPVLVPLLVTVLVGRPS